MRPPRDLLLAVSSAGAPSSTHTAAWDLEPVGAVDPWTVPSSAAFPAYVSDLELLRVAQKRRPWVLAWKVIVAWLMMWFAAWFVLHVATRPTRSQKKANDVMQVVHGQQG